MDITDCWMYWSIPSMCANKFNSLKYCWLSKINDWLAYVPFDYKQSDNILMKIIPIFLDIANLVVRCPDLIELDISDCINLTSDTILQIAKLKHLEYLSMSRCYNVTPTSYVWVLDQIR